MHITVDLLSSQDRYKEFSRFIQLKQIGIKL